VWCATKLRYAPIFALEGKASILPDGLLKASKKCF